jgi:hypothetical protein
MQCHADHFQPYTTLFDLFNVFVWFSMFACLYLTYRYINGPSTCFPYYCIHIQHVSKLLWPSSTVLCLYYEFLHIFKFMAHFLTKFLRQSLHHKIALEYRENNFVNDFVTVRKKFWIQNFKNALRCLFWLICFIRWYMGSYYLCKNLEHLVDISDKSQFYHCK